MPLTPSDVSNKLFGRQVRGYSVDEVDAFLDEVEAELTALLTDNAALKNRLSAASAQQPPPAPVASAPEPVKAQEPQEAALRTLLMAQRTADQAVAEARAEADKMLAQARDRAAQVEQEVNARTTSALAALQEHQSDLQQRIEDLKAFEREYRLRLKAYLESQLKDLQGRGGGAASPSTRVAPPAPVAAPPPPAPAATGPAAAAPVGDGFPQVLPPESAEPHDRSPAGAGAAEPPPAADVPRLAPEPPPAGPPHEAPLAPTPPSLRAVPPLSGEPEPVGPFTVAPPPVQLEQVDDGPEPPTQT